MKVQEKIERKNADSALHCRDLFILSSLHQIHEKIYQSITVICAVVILSDNQRTSPSLNHRYGGTKVRFGWIKDLLQKVGGFENQMWAN